MITHDRCVDHCVCFIGVFADHCIYFCIGSSIVSAFSFKCDSDYDIKGISEIKCDSDYDIKDISEMGMLRFIVCKGMQLVNISHL